MQGARGKEVQGCRRARWWGEAEEAAVQQIRKGRERNGEETMGSGPTGFEWFLRMLEFESTSFLR